MLLNAGDERLKDYLNIRQCLAILLLIEKRLKHKCAIVFIRLFVKYKIN
jgi:hypothetical protein